MKQSLLRLERAAAAALALSFVALCLGEVRNLGVCCADDSMFAMVAKNLAHGLGYSSTMQPHNEDFQVVPFDVDITVGPTVIVPAAVMIKLFGNRYWVPGVSEVLLWSALLLLAWALLRGQLAPRFALPGTAVFFACCAGLFTQSFEQWFALFGEVPAACFLLLAAVTLLGDSRDRGTYLLAASFVGLAAVTKLLAAIYLVPLLAVVLAGRKPPRELARDGAAVVAGFAAPLAAVELWKLISLGPHRYRAMLVELAGFVRSAGVANGAQATLSLWARAAQRAGLLAHQFGPWTVAAAAAALALGAWASLRGPAPTRRTLAFLTGGIAVNVVYWFFLSSGWPRYLVMAAVLVAAIPAITLFAGDRRMALPAAAIAGAIFFANAGRMHREGYGVADGLHGLLSPAAALRPASAQRAADFLLRHKGKDRLPTLWFATTVDMEYLLPGSLNFEMLRFGLPKCEQHGCTVAENRIFRVPNHWYEELLARCKPALEADPYVIYECPPLTPSPTREPRAPRRAGPL